MADKVSKTKRSEIMSSVKQRHTKPELTVRKMLHRNGFRFRLHKKILSSTPDVVLPKYKTVIFVHGCFWHQHKDCYKSRRPTSNVEYWNTKLNRNIERDTEKIQLLNELGWKTIIIWECELKNIEKLEENLKRELLESK